MSPICDRTTIFQQLFPPIAVRPWAYPMANSGATVVAYDQQARAGVRVRAIMADALLRRSTQLDGRA